MKDCDIVVPVYNAYDAVKECINSVLEKTKLGDKTKLILIDDKSPDERIVPLLEDYKKNNPRKIMLIKNEKNLGFVQTVNKGMRLTNKDVLILNSDTEVTTGWLDKIRKCAYSDEMIATATPLASFASLASVPTIFAKNELPEGYTLDGMGELVEGCSLKLYPEILSAHGFCMYIKRVVLDRVGFFDEETFGKGYGEENDFCFRCFKYGYRHVLCDDTYILHKGAESFGEKQYHNKELEAKHPEIWPKIETWIRRKDIRKIGNNIALKISVGEKRPNILIVTEKVEDLFEDDSVSVIDMMRKKCNFHILSVKNGYYEIHSYFKDYDFVTGVFEKSMTVEAVRLYSSEYKKMLEEIVSDFEVSLVYLASMKGQCFDVVTVCKERKIDLVACNEKKLNEFKNEIVEEIDVEVWRNEVHKLLKFARKKERIDKAFLKYSSASAINYETLRDKMLDACRINNILEAENRIKKENLEDEGYSGKKGAINKVTRMSKKVKSLIGNRLK